MNDETAMLRHALARAKVTNGKCGAIFRYQSRKEPFEWVDGLFCTHEPGHSGKHMEWEGGNDPNTLYGSVHPGGVDTMDWTDDAPGALASPWTDDAPGALASPWTPLEVLIWDHAG